jgi:hypothetical protein
MIRQRKGSGLTRIYSAVAHPATVPQARRTGIMPSLGGGWSRPVSDVRRMPFAGSCRLAFYAVPVETFTFSSPTSGVEGSARAGGGRGLRAGAGRAPLDHPGGGLPRTAAGRLIRRGTCSSRCSPRRRRASRRWCRCSRLWPGIRGGAGSRSGCGWGCIPGRRRRGCRRGRRGARGALDAGGRRYRAERSSACPGPRRNGTQPPRPRSTADPRPWPVCRPLHRT